MGLNGEGGSSLFKWGGYENREVLTPSGAGQATGQQTSENRGKKTTFSSLDM